MIEQAVEVQEVAHGRGDLEVGVGRRERVRRADERRLGDVDGDVVTQRSRVREGVEEDPGLRARSGPELDERRCLGRHGDRLGVLDQERPLGAGGVVLLEPRDLVEQLAADVVVEPDRGQRLGGREEPGACVALEGIPQGVAVQSDVDRDRRGAHGASWASRSPV